MKRTVYFDFFLGVMASVTAVILWDVVKFNYKKSKQEAIPKGYHKMPDGTVMLDSAHKK
tara:strand:- start:765 stop:941 length:177 start_codon:yes stop_codon:yes gene_type:complete